MAAGLAATPVGPLPPMLFGPKGAPVRTRASWRALAGSETSITLSEFDCGALGSPSPGTVTGPAEVGTLTPSQASFDGKPKAGKGMAVVCGCRGSAPGMALYWNMPVLVTYRCRRSGESAMRNGRRPVVTLETSF